MAKIEMSAFVVMGALVLGPLMPAGAQTAAVKKRGSTTMCQGAAQGDWWLRPGCADGHDLGVVTKALDLLPRREQFELSDSFTQRWSAAMAAPFALNLNAQDKIGLHASVLDLSFTSGVKTAFNGDTGVVTLTFNSDDRGSAPQDWFVFQSEHQTRRLPGYRQRLGQTSYPVEVSRVTWRRALLPSSLFAEPITFTLPKQDNLGAAMLVDMRVTASIRWPCCESESDGGGQLMLKPWLDVETVDKNYFFTPHELVIYGRASKQVLYRRAL